VSVQFQLPKMALTVQGTHHITQRRLGFRRCNDRDHDCFNGLNGVIPGIGSVRVAPIDGDPCIAQFSAGLVSWLARILERFRGSGIDSPSQTGSV
jgi:hypothetical protein